MATGPKYLLYSVHPNGTEMMNARGSSALVRTLLEQDKKYHPMLTHYYIRDGSAKKIYLPAGTTEFPPLDEDKLVSAPVEDE